MTAQKLDIRAPVAPQLHSILREKIVRNELLPDVRLSETEIAKTYNVSRQPAREAFIRLANEGLVEILPQRGTIVRRIDYAAVLNARFVREAIEADIVALLAARPSPALIAGLRAEIATQRDIPATEPLRFMAADEAFHCLLASGAGKAGVWSLTEGLKSQMDRVRFLSFAQFPMAKLITQHEALIDRIEAGDISGADNAIRSHLREVLQDLPAIQAAHPEYFDMPETDPAELVLNKEETGL